MCVETAGLRLHLGRLTARQYRISRQSVQIDVVINLTNCWVRRHSTVCPLSTASVENSHAPSITRLWAHSFRRMRSRLWRGGKRCGLRVEQNLANHFLLHPHRPPVTIVTLRSADGAWQGETDLPGPDLLVVAHGGDQVVHPAGIRPFDR